jgi:uncharacterized protein
MRDLTGTKFDAIRNKLAGKSVLVAFSGGVDSTVLASIVSEVAESTILLLISSPTVTETEIDNAKAVAKELALDLVIKDFNWLSDEHLIKNEIDRCFRCKEQLAALWTTTARELGFDIVVEGTTASETTGHRPGLKALKKSGVQSPYLDVGMTKSEIREYAKERRISVADKPSMACLATRFPYGVEISLERLSMVERVERAVVDIFGVECVRARYHGDLVRIEVAESELEQMFDVSKMKRLEARAHDAGFTYVTLDLRGYRTGAMDEGLGVQKPI